MNKPVAFVPTLPEPTQAVKRRRSTKTILAAQCRVCHRGTDPGNNRIVFCDGCNTAYHQYCHDPPISSEVVTVLEKEWMCGPCHRSKQNIIEGTEGLTTAEGLSIDEVCHRGTTSPSLIDSCRNVHISQHCHRHVWCHSFSMLPFGTQSFLYSHPMCRVSFRTSLPHPHRNHTYLHQFHLRQNLSMVPIAELHALSSLPIPAAQTLTLQKRNFLLK